MSVVLDNLVQKVEQTRSVERSVQEFLTNLIAEGKAMAMEGVTAAVTFWEELEEKADEFVHAIMANTAGPAPEPEPEPEPDDDPDDDEPDAPTGNPKKV